MIENRNNAFRNNLLFHDSTRKEIYQPAKSIPFSFQKQNIAKHKGVPVIHDRELQVTIFRHSFEKGSFVVYFKVFEFGPGCFSVCYNEIF